MAAGPADASIVTTTDSGSSGSLSASVVFAYDNVANTLTITLTNTSAADVTDPSQVLTAVFFTIDPSATILTPVSAKVASGSTVLFPPLGVAGAAGPNMGGEWAYASGLQSTKTKAPHNAALGVSSSGLNLFGAGNFNGPNLQGPDSVDGVQYGITSAGDNPATGNQKVTGTQALIKNSVVFVLSVSGELNDVNSVTFQYGTDLTETEIYVVGLAEGAIVSTPEPATFIIWSLLGAGSWLGMRVYRRGRRVGRQSWSPEARKAIHAIIASGSHKRT